MTEPRILVEVSDAVATVVINRPQVLNALDPTTTRELADALEAQGREPGIRAVVLAAAGRAFCAGGDMKGAHRHIEAGHPPASYFAELIVHLNRAVLALRTLEKPTIAAVNGVASGAGLSLAAACDLRLAGESARFRPAFGSIGQVPGGGWSLTVPRLLGAARAFELLYSQRVLDAQAAHALGLVSEVVADAGLAAVAHARAAAIAAGPAAAFAGAKALINAAIFSDLEVHLERERARILAQAETPEFRAALLTFIEKREPAFGPARRDDSRK
jgi:2-(1,2-epoxy-1,2-dihydrophenyl)acetyl-CoA isomerase